MASIIAATVGNLLEMDHVNTERVGDETVYTFKTTSLIKSLTELKAKILSILDFPVDIPHNVEIEEVKDGILFKEYIVKIYVNSRMVGKVENLIAKKYGIIRHRPYVR